MCVAGRHADPPAAVTSNWVVGVDAFLSVFIFGPTLFPPPSVFGVRAQIRRACGSPCGVWRKAPPRNWCLTPITGELTAIFGRVLKQRKYSRPCTLKTCMDFGICNSIFGIGFSGSTAVMRRRVTQTWVIGVRHQFRYGALCRPRRGEPKALRIWALTPKTLTNPVVVSSGSIFFGQAKKGNSPAGPRPGQ